MGFCVPNYADGHKYLRAKQHASLPGDDFGVCINLDRTQQFRLAIAEVKEMSSFTSALIVSPMPDGRRWKLFKSFKYRVGSRYSKNAIIVPAGFVTDFASIPWIFWSWLPSWGKHGKAAVIHDRLYQTHEVSRGMADLIFYEAMLVSKTKKWKAKLMYFAVRIFGWSSYYKRRKK